MVGGQALDARFDTRRRGALALSCAVHVLALWYWSQEARVLPARPFRAVPRMVTIVLQSDGSRTPRPPPGTPGGSTAAPPRTAPASPARASAQAAIGQRTDTTPLPAPAAPALPAPPSAPDTPASVPDAIDTATPANTAADVRAAIQAQAAQAPGPGGLVSSLAKRQAGRVDRELRNGKPGVPAEADTPSGRFQRRVESAYIDRTLTLQSDTYTSPDGVVIYRFRQGNRYRCRRAGGVGMPLRGFADGASANLPGASSAAETDCPKGVTWNRDDL
jgi:hypothetical protein